jgi:CBS domain-containing protein
MYTVADIMTRDPVVLAAGDDLTLAEALFAFGRFRHLPVVEGGRLVGLVTQRDYLKAVGAEGPGAGRRIAARDVMTRKVLSVRPETSLRKALAVMVRKKYGCLPVVDEEDRVLGIVTEADATRFAARVIRDMETVQDTFLAALVAHSDGPLTADAPATRRRRVGPV